MLRKLVDVLRVGLGPRVDPHAMHKEATMEGRSLALNTSFYSAQSTRSLHSSSLLRESVLIDIDECHLAGFFIHIHSPASVGNPYTIVVIFCEVKHAIDPNSRVMVYVLWAPGHQAPQNLSASPQDPCGFASELLSSSWKVIKQNEALLGDVHEWKVQVEGIGTMEIGRQRQKWTVHIPADQTSGHGPLELLIETTKRTPWTTESRIAGPEGVLRAISMISETSNTL
jgi:hypothetical protein